MLGMTVNVIKLSELSINSYCGNKDKSKFMLIKNINMKKHPERYNVKKGNGK